MQTQTQTIFEEAVNKARARVLETQPVDARQPLSYFQFGFMEKDGQVQPTMPALAPLRDDTKPELNALPEVIRLSDLALNQLCQRVDFPASILSKGYPAPWIARGLNWGMQNLLPNDRISMIRMINGDHARAILGSRYTPMDDVQLLALCEEHLRGAEVRVESFGAMSTMIVATFPDEVDVEMGLQRGLRIGNSEVGARAITIEAIAWRHVCANVMPAVGLGGSDEGIGSDGQLYVRRDRRGGRGALQGQRGRGFRFIHTGNEDSLRDWIRVAIEDSARSYEGLVAKWREGLRYRMENPTDAIEGIAQGRRLTREQLKAALDAYATDDTFGVTLKPTPTSIANAFTLAAQKEEENEGREAMENAGLFALERLTKQARDEATGQQVSAS
jgi:hypothetical protein